MPQRPEVAQTAVWQLASWMPQRPEVAQMAVWQLQRGCHRRPEVAQTAVWQLASWMPQRPKAAKMASVAAGSVEAATAGDGSLVAVDVDAPSRMAAGLISGLDAVW
eukprot:jgi/Ulvmu1/4008/UM187_0001.1